MAVLKNKTQGLYVNVGKGILTNKELSLRDRGMLTTILSLPDNWNFSITGLTKILPDGKKCVSSSLQELKRMGYLTEQQNRAVGGKFGGNVIEVHETPIMVTPQAAFRQADNGTQLNNQEVTNKVSITSSINPSYYKIVCEDFKEQIAYDALIFDYPEDKDMIDGIVDIATEILALSDETIRVAKTEKPIVVVQAQMRKLTMMSIQYVLECVKKEAGRMQNPKQYLLTCLYNAPLYEQMYWQNRVANDMKEGM